MNGVALALIAAVAGARAEDAPPVDSGAGEAPRNAPQRVGTTDTGEHALQEGDRLWWTGDRPAARRAFRAGLRQVRAEVERLRDAGAPVPPATLAREARLRLRLIRLGSNWTPTFQGGRMFRALDACPLEDPACVLAEAELALLLPPWAGGNLAQVAELLGDRVDPPALARRAAATRDTGLLDALRDLPPELRDGAGTGMVQAGRALPEDPGTRTFAFGVGGAPGAGLGLSLAWVDPDLAGTRRRLDLQLSADTRGGGYVGGGVTGLAGHGRANAARTVLDDWRSGQRALVPIDALRGEGGWTWRWGRAPTGTAEVRDDVGPPTQVAWSLDLGADARAEAAGAWGAGWGAATGGSAQEWQRAAGPTLSLGWARARGTRHASVRAWGESGFGDYTHLAGGLDLRGRALLPWEDELAGRVAVSAAPTPDTPWWRLPSAGGSTVLRGAPLGRWRAPSLMLAQVEVRRTVWGPIRMAGFVDAALPGPRALPGVGATAADLHATAGAGLRVGVPGAEAASTRIDVGWSLDAPTRGEWGLVVGVGEAF